MTPMSADQNILGTIKAHRTLFIIVMVALFLIELEIFAIAAMRAGRKPVLQIADQSGKVVLVLEGGTLSQVDRQSFEKTFGPLEQYRVRMYNDRKPFPFRAWFAAAFGMPIGLVLLFAFIVRAWSALFAAPRRPVERGTENGAAPLSGFERMLTAISRFNIFVLGALILLAAAAYWVLPNAFLSAGKAGLRIIVTYKWAALGLAMTLVGMLLLIIFLRYLLAKKSLESRVEVEKFRLRLEYEHRDVPRLDYNDLPPQDTTACKCEALDVKRET